MGSAISRCTSRSSERPPSRLAEKGQKILDKQPNWLVPPSKWRSRPSSQPVRYRTPTPYPKDDRKRLEDDPSVHIHTPEKTIIIEGPVVSHVAFAETPRKRNPKQLHGPHPSHPHSQRPPTALTITWERAPRGRLNRFERVE